MNFNDCYPSKRFVRQRYLLIILSGFIFYPNLRAQEETAVEASLESRQETFTLAAGADLVSSYIWRGQNFGHSPAIQPSMSVSAFGFSLGAWGSYAFSQFQVPVNDTTTVSWRYNELDLFLSYTYKYFTLMLYDYYSPGPIDTIPGADYFNWNNRTTYHTLEASFIFDGPDKIPLQFIAAVLLYGADKGKDTTGLIGAGDKNNYSTYFELSYLFRVKGFSIRPFIGGIPFGSAWYGEKAGINNVGINISKEIPVSGDYSIPVRTGLMFNPLESKAYLVFILSL